MTSAAASKCQRVTSAQVLPRRRLVIRADAGPDIGLGHVMRMLALAQAWKSRRGDVLFITHAPDPWVAERLSREGIALVSVDSAHPQARDLEQLLALTRTGDWIVLDGYHFDAAYMDGLRRACRRTIVMDDINDRGRYPVSVLVNQNINAAEYAYDLPHGTLALLGTEYALIRNDIMAVSKSIRLAAPDWAVRILVTFGGSDLDGDTLKALRALKDVGDSRLHVRVVAGRFFGKRKEIEPLVASLPFECECFFGVEDMSSLYAWADLALAGAGASCWEMCLLGLPMLLRITADNQRGIGKGLERAGAAVVVDSFSPEMLADLMRDRARREVMARAGRALVDGKGRERIASVRNVLFLGYDEDRHSLIGALRRAGCLVDHTEGKIESVEGYDLVISYGYKHIVTPDVIAQGVPIVNLHVSYLPYNRGSHPNFWAFFDGTPHGVTIHLMDEGIDTGPIVAQREVVFSENETTFEDTFSRLRTAMEELFLEKMPQLLAGNIPARPQAGKGSFHRDSDLPVFPNGWKAEIDSTLVGLRSSVQDKEG